MKNKVLVVSILVIGISVCVSIIVLYLLQNSENKDKEQTVEENTQAEDNDLNVILGIKQQHLIIESEMNSLAEKFLREKYRIKNKKSISVVKRKKPSKSRIIKGNKLAQNTRDQRKEIDSEALIRTLSVAVERKGMFEK